MTQTPTIDATRPHHETMDRWIEQAINRGNLEVIDSLAHPDYTYRNPTEELRGTDAIKGLFRAYRAAFPDFHVQVNQRLAEGDRMSQAVTVTGTHQGEFMGIAATGRKVEVHAMVMTRFKDGKIAEEWEVLDQLGVMG